MQNRRECKLFGRRARIPACNICVKQHNSHGRPRKSSRCLAFEAFTKIRTASRVVEVGTTGMYDRLRSWCPAALSYAAVLMTRKPASNRFVFPDRSLSGFLRNSHSRRDDPRLVFRSKTASRMVYPLDNRVGVGGAPTPGPGNKAPCYPANTVIVVFITGPADDSLVVSSIHSSGYIPDQDR